MCFYLSVRYELYVSNTDVNGYKENWAIPNLFTGDIILIVVEKTCRRLESASKILFSFNYLHVRCRIINKIFTDETRKTRVFKNNFVHLIF